MIDHTKVHEEEYKGFTIKIRWDEDPQGCNPRDYNNLGVLSWWHRRYDFKEDRDGKQLWREIDREGESENYGEPVHEDDLRCSDLIYLPVYMYDHSGITVNTGGFNCPWDSGQLGWIWCTKEAARLEWPNTKDEQLVALAEDRLRAEIKSWDLYLTGQVYGYEVYGLDWELVDSCWGFLGDWETEALAQAKGSVDWYYEQELMKGENI